MRITSLAIIALCCLAFNSQAAQAQGARFKFAPHVWLKDPSCVPRSYYAPPPPQPVLMPKSSDFLGLNSLNEAPKTQVSLRYAPSFGTPQSSCFGTPLRLANFFPAPQGAAPRSMQSIKKHASARPSKHTIHKSVSGKLRTTKHRPIQAEQALAYSSGYEPGESLHAVSNSRHKADSTVRGVVIFDRMK